MKKNCTHIILIFLSIVFFEFSLIGQTPNNGSIELDNRIYNGKYYNYFLPKSVYGNQFLSKKENSIGIVWKKGVEFDGLLLNYDVLNQQVLLEFTTNEGAMKLISLSMVDVDSFYFENKKFVIDTNISKLGNIYQCIYYKGIKLYFYYSKILTLQSKLNDIEYHFNKLSKDIFFYENGNYYKVKKNSKFIKKLNPSIAGNVKRYMKSKKYKLKKMDDEQYLDILVYIKDKAIE